MKKKTTILIIFILALLALNAVILSVKVYPFVISFFNDSGEIRAVKESEKYYAANKTFHDYYLEALELKKSGANPDPLYYLMQIHCEDLTSPEVKSFTEELNDYVLKEDFEKFFSLVSKDSENSKIYYDGKKLIEGDTENNLMFVYYQANFFNNKGGEICAKHNQTSDCREYLDTYSDKEFKLRKKYEEKVKNS